MPHDNPSGSFGAPPANAPYEVAQPLSPETIQAQLDRARANERSLAPLVFEKGPLPNVEPVKVAPPSADSPLNAAAKALADAKRARVDPDAPYQPAASDTDSPSRGMPQPITDPNKVITGGWGHAGEAQYYALDGSELREMTRHLFDELNGRLDNDLRFHPAITYPRVAVRVVIEIEGWAVDGQQSIEQVAVPHDKTPIEIARQHGDHVAFALVAQRREFADDGSIENPPDRMRDELGLPKPRKQMVQAGAMRIMVDTPTAADPNLF